MTSLDVEFQSFSDRCTACVAVQFAKSGARFLKSKMFVSADQNCAGHHACTTQGDV